MADFYEIDLVDVDAEKSGDAITVRYQIGNSIRIHVVDGGYQKTGERLVAHINKYYGAPKAIDHVVVTHNDGDHTGGLREVLEKFQIGTLWMLRPWIYAAQLLPYFPTYNSVQRLETRLRSIYGNLRALEEIALERRIAIQEPWQGVTIGAFTVLSPSPAFFGQMIIESDKTPEAPILDQAASDSWMGAAVDALVKPVVKFIKKGWGFEAFSDQPTSAENEMSVIQYANLCDEKILLTGDAGRRAMSHALSYAKSIGVPLPGIKRFQVPHHASRRNISTDLLDAWLGPKLPQLLPPGQEKFTAMICSSKPDEDHPRKAVTRALHHRGAKVCATEGSDYQFNKNAPDRGWVPIVGMGYSEDIEE